MEKTALIAFTLLTAALAGCVGDLPQASNPHAQVHEIHMWVEEMEWEVHPGVTEAVWAFCAEGDAVEPVHGDEACGVPGPTIRVTEGDLVRVTLENTHHIPHSVHFHGWHPFEADQAGAEILGHHQVVHPGEAKTFEWTAEPTGTFIYHCHFDTHEHMDHGMYGVFIVEEKDAQEPDVEHVMVLDEWAIYDNATPYEGAMPAYNYFTINGKSFPATQPILADVGDTVRVHIVNAGYKAHAMHIHGHTPDSWEGIAGPEHAVPTDVRNVAPGQSVVMETTVDREGIWPFHCHVVPHVTANATGDGWGDYPRGMLTILAVGEEYHAALQEAGPILLEEALAEQGLNPTEHTSHNEPEDTEATAEDGDDIVVEMRDYAFQPETITIEPGTTVTWVNKDSAWHDVTFDDGSVESGEIPARESWSYTFTEEGTYTYHCSPHAFYDADEESYQGMTGTVIVQGG